VVGGVFRVLLLGYGAAYSFGAFFHSLRDEFGATRQEIALLFALTGFLYFGLRAVSGRLALGGTVDRLGRRQALAGSFLLLALTQLWRLRAGDAWSLAVFAMVFGVGYGGFVALIPALASDCFGVRHAGAIVGLLYTSAAFGSLAGPTLVGIAFYLRHSSTLPILGSVLANLVAAGCMAVLGDAQRFRAVRQARERAAVRPTVAAQGLGS
jgi:MFS family permease